MPPIAILIALADPTRRRIIEILKNGPQPVHVVAGAFKISRPAISRHLRVLKQAKLISEKKSGRENRYALHPEKLKPVALWIAEIRAPVQGETVSELKAKAATAKKAVTPPVKAVKPSASAAVATQAVAAAPASQMGFDF